MANPSLNDVLKAFDAAMNVASKEVDSPASFLFGDSATELRKDTREGLDDIRGNLAKVESEFQSGDRGVGDYILGTGYYGLGEPLERAASYVTPDFIEEYTGEIAQFLTDKTGLNEYLETLDPTTKRRFTEALGLFGAVGPVKGLGRVATPKLDPQSAGRDLSSANVIIENYYDPRQKKYGNWLEKQLTELFPDADTTKAGQNKIQNAIRKGLGLSEWGVKGARRVVNNLFNPRTRALYNEYGLSAVFTDTTKILKRELTEYERLKGLKGAPDAPDNLDELLNTQKAKVAEMIETAHSQVQQTANIRQQTNAKAGKRDVPMEFALAAADPNVPQMYFKKSEVGDDWYHSTAGQAATLDGISPEMSKFAQDHIERVWKNSGLDMSKAKVLVKAPRSKATGDHFASLSTNVQINAIERAFRPSRGGQVGGFYDVELDTDGTPRLVPNIDSLEEALKRAKSTDEGLLKAGKSFSIQGRDAEGVWIQFSHPSRAKVEGGMNMLVHVKPNGDLTGIASDLHDFFNEAPVAGPLLKQLMPSQVIAVTPPMQTNVFSISTLRSKKLDDAPLKEEYGEFIEDRVVDQPSAGETLEGAKQRVLDASEIRPSASGTAQEAISSAQNVTFMGRVLSPEEQEQEAQPTPRTTEDLPLSP